MLILGLELTISNLLFMIYLLGSMCGWVDQFGCYANQFCLVVAIVMPMSLYRS